MSEEKMRASFETWVRKDKSFHWRWLDRIDGDPDYCAGDIQRLWEAWQAALSSLPQSEDAARLDWIQHEVDSGGMFALEKFGGSWVKLFTASTQHMKQKPSVRAAIDAAISAQENKS